MTTKEINTEADAPRRSWTAWLWVFLCAAGIYTTIPVARSIQIFIYDTLGKEFFTYIVVFIVSAVLASVLYFFTIKLKVKNTSQYVWLVICAGLYACFTFHLKAHPEEAIHLIEYGLLYYFVFKALCYKVRDWTVYITALFIVVFFGIMDEFLQWLMPTRFWDYKDVGINALGGAIFMLTLSKGIRPQVISNPVKRSSINLLIGTLTINLVILGLCLSNTPDNVRRYTSIIRPLLWLQGEEPMTEFGYEHKDPEIGLISSRLTLEEIRKTDMANGSFYGEKIPEDISTESAISELVKKYNPYTNKFLHEFLIHISRRDHELREFRKTDNVENWLTACKENEIIQKYFGNTLKHTNDIWPDETSEYMGNTASLWNEEYSSDVGRIITSFTLKTAWSLILILLVVAWISGNFWKRRLNTN